MAHYKKARRNLEMIDWWFGTVFLAFFPMLFSVIADFYRNGTVDIYRIFGDGELILSSFLITTPSLMNLHKKGNIKNIYKLLFYVLLFAAFFQLIAYTIIKTNATNNPIVVYITSGLCVISSIFISWQGERCIKEESEK